MYTDQDFYAVVSGTVAHLKAPTIEDAVGQLTRQLGMRHPVMLRGRARRRIQYLCVSDGIRQFQLWEPEDWARYSEAMPRRAANRRPERTARP